MSYRLTLISLSLILSLIPLCSFANRLPPIEVQAPENDSTWKHLNTKDEITIFLRQSQHHSVIEGIGKGVINAPPCRVFQVLGDGDRLVKFMPYVKARIVKHARADREHVCQYLDLPWPIKDRFITFRVDRIRHYRKHPCEFFVYWRKDETYSCTIEEVKETHDDAVSEPVVPVVNDGYWHLLPHDGGEKTLAYYYVLSNPGGKIPTWLKNFFVDDAILKIFRAVRGQVAKSDLYPPCQCR